MTDRVIRVVVDPSGVTRGAGRAGRSLDNLERRSRGLSTSFKAAAAAAGAFAASLAVREVFQAVDAYQSLQNRLRIVTDSSEELAQVQGRLFDIAQESRTSFEATAQLYSRAAIAADELGASQEQLLRLTEISGKALAIQGSSAAEASGALRQLSQSFSSGIVRAEEFNSILEGAFPIAQAAARGIDEAGGSVGRLRQLVVEGEISSREFFEAILEGGAEIDAQLGDTEATLSQALQTISNSFLNLVGAVNDASGAGSGLAGVLTEISRGIDSFTAAITGALSPTDELSTAVKVLATATITVGAAFSALGDVIDATLGQALRGLIETLGSVGEAFGALIDGDFQRLPEIFAELGEDLTENFNESTEGLGDIADTVQNAADRIRLIWDETAREVVDISKKANEDTKANPPVDPNTADSIRDARDAVREYQQALTEQTAVLELQAALGEDAADAIRQFKAETELAAAANEIFGDLVPTAEVEALKEAFVEYGAEALAAQEALRAEIENEAIRQSFDEQIESLEEEIFLLGADTEAIALNAEARALAGGATAEQAERIRELTTELENSRDAQDNASNNLNEFFEGAKDSAESSLAGLLADPLNADLDDVAAKFSQVLLDLAAEALASEIFGLFSGGFGGGGGGGGIGALVGSFFGGGFQAGGQVRGGQPILVGERGPELFSPPTSGSITPNVNINQAAQAPPVVMVNNITDPADVPAGLRSAEGQEEVINIIQRNPDAVRKILG